MQESLIGKKFGRWLVVDRATNDKQGRTHWHCICECGNKSVVFGNALRSGKSTSCRRHAGKRKIDKTTLRECIQCGKTYKLPICRLKRLALCSSECSEARRVSRKESKRKVCLICGSQFYPRPNQVRAGHGKVCSKKCRSEHFKTIPRTEEWIRKSSIAQKGRPGMRGPDNPKWKGGYEFCYRQRIKDGRKAAQCRKYRSKHPEKVREWYQNRRGKKVGRLPNGTVAGLLIKQGNRCAACKKKLGRYHVDHIEPISKGGKHKADNVQILCPSCNVRKSAKDPIKFMQEMGFLL